MKNELNLNNDISVIFKFIDKVNGKRCLFRRPPAGRLSFFKDGVKMESGFKVRYEIASGNCIGATITLDAPYTGTIDWEIED